MAELDDRSVDNAVLEHDPHAGREAIAFLESAVDAMSASVVRLDAGGLIRYVNRSRAGFSLAEVIGKRPEEFVPEENRAYVRERIDHAMTSGEVTEYEVTGYGAGSRPARYRVTASPYRIDGAVRGLSLVAFDVTEARIREEQLRLATEVAGVGVFRWDIATNEVVWNEQMFAITGATHPATPHEYLAIVHPEDRGDVERAARGLITKGTFQSFTHRIVRPNGEVRYVVTVGDVRRAGEVPTMLVGALLDVTEQRRNEEHLRQRHKLEAVGQLAAGVAHNFNNLLAAMLPTLDLVRVDLEGDHLVAVEDALHAGRRAAEMVRQLMTFARAPVREGRDVQPVADVVRRALGICRRLFEPHVHLECSLGDETLLVQGDASKLDQVIVNVLLNARDAIAHQRPSPPIVIEVSRTSGAESAADEAANYVRIRVSDKGAGMTEEVQRRMFEPFFTTKEIGRGTGLGLATAFAIVEEHGGRIRATSEPELGTTVDVYLPLVHDGVEASRTASVPPARGELVLIIDDEMTVRRVTALILQDAGYRVAVAASLSEARAVLGALNAPSLILVDDALPDASGSEVIRALRILVPVAKVAYFTSETGMETAGIPLLEKPLTSAALVRAVRDLLDGRPLAGTPSSAGSD